MLLFSDLHLSPRTFDTCMEVLRRVHREAVERDVSVGFLGDFFDHVYNKGTLPVDILNALMRFFATEWTVPMVMIPGNHDYFDRSETEHGLTPFGYASKHITVLDNPTVIDRQLWVPWRRDTAVLKKILHDNADVDVIFGHFDIVGFKMSASRVSTEGLARETFPTHIPIYSGHYHTPQMHGNIRYLGSPYQLTMSEAEDKKSLCILGHAFAVDTCLPLDIGRRQYKWTAEQLVARSGELRANDRVSLVVTDQTPVESLLDTLRVQGVELHITKPPKPVTTRIENHHEMSPLELFETWAQVTNVNVQSVAYLTLLAKIQISPMQMSNSVHNVKPVRLSIEGFGPFTGPLHLPLQGNGFTLVSGECDNSKSHSNGAGKSLLAAGALLWVCTGMVDGRSSLQFDSENVVNKNVGRAKVTVSGTLGSTTWQITRTLDVRDKRKHAIILEIDGENCTRSTIAGTQREIAAQIFGFQASAKELYTWLLNNSVWSQQGVPRWLGASDVAAKQEIHKLSNIHIWSDILTWAKANHKQEAASCLHIEATLRTKQGERDRAEARWRGNRELADTWKRTHQTQLQQSEEELKRLSGECQKAVCVEQCAPVDESGLDALRTRWMNARVVYGQMGVRLAELMSVVRKPGETYVEDLLLDCEAEEVRLGSVEWDTETASVMAMCLAEVQANQTRVAVKDAQLCKMKVDSSCSTCKRAFENGPDFIEQVERLSTELAVCRGKLAESRHRYVVAKQAHVDAGAVEKRHRGQLDRVRDVRTVRKLDTEIRETADQIATDKAQIVRQQLEVEQQRHRYESFVRDRVLRDQLHASLRALQRNHDAKERETCPYRVDKMEVATLARACTCLEESLLKARTLKQQWSEIMQWTGPRGIQTYALEYTVKTLAAKTSNWLQRLFSTDTIRLHASFDKKERLQRNIEYTDHAGVLSGGQWRRAELAAFMARREMSPFQFPLLVMDEACASMDAAGIQAVQQALRNWCDEDDERTCYFISHDSEQHRDTSVYNNHARITNKRGRSSLVDEDCKRQRIS